MTFKPLDPKHWWDDPDLDYRVVTASRLFDVRFLLTEILNELRTIRALHCSLPSPESLVNHHDKDGGK